MAEASLWQLIAAVDGWRAANSSEDEEGLTDAEFDSLFEEVERYQAATVH